MYIITITKHDGTEIRRICYSWTAALLFIEENFPWTQVAIVYGY